MGILTSKLANSHVFLLGKFSLFYSPSVNNMTLEELRRFLQQLLIRTDGLLAIVISDSEGVPLVKATRPDYPEPALRPFFLSLASSFAEQVEKLKLGHLKNLVATYETYQVVYINLNPVFIALIAQSDALTGLLLAVESDLRPVVPVFQNVVSEHTPVA